MKIKIQYFQMFRVKRIEVSSPKIFSINLRQAWRSELIHQDLITINLII